MFKNVPVVCWSMFESSLMKSFIPRELEEEKIGEFLTLNAEYMNVHEYSLEFTQLSRYAPKIVVDMRRRMSLLFTELSHWSSKEGKKVMLIGDIDLARLMIHVQHVEEDKLKDRKSLKIKGLRH